MKILLKNARVFDKTGFSVEDVFVSEGIASSPTGQSPDLVFSLDGLYIFPGLTDVHVHLREPGFSYKETIKTGTAAASRGGFTTVLAMPNLNPPPDGREGLYAGLAAIARGALVRVLPYGTITKGSRGEELSDFEDMPEAVAFSDDGHGTPPHILEAAMQRVKKLGRIICSHCEDVSQKGGDHVAAGSPYAKKLMIPGISNESEYLQLERELYLAEKTGCPYHVCHVSCRESVELIRRAKARGLDVTCETAPHYFALDYTDIDADDGRYKMNPPLRSPRDRQAIIEGICDGTIDMIATDHAPHSRKEKSRGLLGSAMGVVGLETAFTVSYTALVKTGLISLHRLVELMSINPARRFGTGIASLSEGAPADLAVFDLDACYTVNPDDFLSMGKSTPFAGRRVFGECVLTICGGKIVYKKDGL
ncbi:MAG: dihydroorotase [Eubacteriales bacterium]|jgi:dihydroorotase